MTLNVHDVSSLHLLVHLILPWVHLTHLRNTSHSVAAGPNNSVDIVPCLNPDGVIMSFEEHRAWRGNANNVDLNRNFGTGWHHNDRSQSEDNRGWNYRGDVPFSEVETQALDGLLTERNYHLVIDIHSQAGRHIPHLNLCLLPQPSCLPPMPSLLPASSLLPAFYHFVS